MNFTGTRRACWFTAFSLVVAVGLPLSTALAAASSVPSMERARHPQPAGRGQLAWSLRTPIGRDVQVDGTASMRGQSGLRPGTVAQSHAAHALRHAGKNVSLPYLVGIHAWSDFPGLKVSGVITPALADENDSKFSDPMIAFHKTTYTKAGMQSGYFQQALLPLFTTTNSDTNHLATATWLATIYKTQAAALAQFADAQTVLKGLKPAKCQVRSSSGKLVTIPDCAVYAYLNFSGKVKLSAGYLIFAMGDVLGEAEVLGSTGDFSNKVAGPTFGYYFTNFVPGAIVDAQSVLTPVKDKLNPSNAGNLALLWENFPSYKVSFGILTPKLADEQDQAFFDPFRTFHKTTYTLAGMQSGYFQQEELSLPTAVSGTYHAATAYWMGSIYKTVAEATAQYHDALKYLAQLKIGGAACSFNVKASNGKTTKVTYKNCAVYGIQFTSKGIPTSDADYAIFAEGNTVGEAEVTTSYQNAHDQKYQGPADLNDFWTLLYGGLQTLYANFGA